MSAASQARARPTIGWSRTPRSNAGLTKYDKFNWSDYVNQIAVANKADRLIKPKGGVGKCVNTIAAFLERASLREARFKVKMALQRK